MSTGAPLPIKNAQEIEKLKGEKQFFEWTPTLSCLTESEALTVEYTRQTGYGCKIKINDSISIVFVECFIRGSITAVSSGNNYATIKGLPYKNSLSNSCPSFNFNNFYKGIDTSHSIPTGFINNKIIRVQDSTNTARGAAVEKWVTCTNFEITGSGFYFTNE